jgi:hypothetical protein
MNQNIGGSFGSLVINTIMLNINITEIININTVMSIMPSGLLVVSTSA